ncbi:MAG: prepilin-type N-terminal cleavage/methylation domain-containing protein [Candidatus Omnitrophota bacterium]|jgi:type IV pilus assembly protein PilV
MAVRCGIKNQRGFTLVEVVLAMGVVVIAVIGIISANVLIQQHDETAFENSVALQDSQRVMEQMRNVASNAGGLFPNNVVNAFPNNALIAGFANLTSETARVSYANTAVTPLDVTVTVTWQDARRRARNVTLRTLIAQRL